MKTMRSWMAQASQISLIVLFTAALAHAQGEAKTAEEVNWATIKAGQNQAVTSEVSPLTALQNLEDAAWITVGTDTTQSRTDARSAAMVKTSLASETLAVSSYANMLADEKTGKDGRGGGGANGGNGDYSYGGGVGVQAEAGATPRTIRAN